MVGWEGGRCGRVGEKRGRSVVGTKPGTPAEAAADVFSSGLSMISVNVNVKVTPAITYFLTKVTKVHDGGGGEEGRLFVVFWDCI